MMRNQLLSCSNCWFNGLQHGAAGLSVGYCVEHRVILRHADETTCGRHMRKDLTLDSARRERRAHQDRYATDRIQLVATANEVVNGAYLGSNTAFLERDEVGMIVSEYGELHSKIESLATLRRLPSPRADLALFSLGRAYVDRCVDRGGPWTSGVHLLMWARERLERLPEPALQPADFRYETATTQARQFELAAWSILMLRLVFVSDVGSHAASQDDEAGQLFDIAERAAAETGTLKTSKLATWIRRRGIPLIDHALPRARYTELARALHSEPEHAP